MDTERRHRGRWPLEPIYGSVICVSAIAVASNMISLAVLGLVDSANALWPGPIAFALLGFILVVIGALAFPSWDGTR